MIIVLLVAALISGFIVHEWADALIILAVVILNAAFGVFQESKAEEAIERCRKCRRRTRTCAAAVRS